MPNMTSDEFDLDIRLAPQDAVDVSEFATARTSRPTRSDPCCTDNCCDA